MNDLKVVIDAGHGGTDPGTVGNGLKEKDLTLEISRYMEQRFRELGVPVVLVRSTDETVSPAERVRRIMAAYGNDPNVVVISNHINSSGTANGAEGAEVIYALRNNDTLARNILQEIGKEGQIIRRVYQRRLPSNTSKDYYFIHRETGVTQPVIVEYAFIDNANDIRRLQENYRRYVDAVVRAVTGNMNNNPTPPNPVDQTQYVVQNGDTLWGIAQKYNTTVEELKSFNNLTSNTLMVGQILKIPTEENMPPNTGSIYIVEEGDTLWAIAQKYNTTVDAIKRANNLVNDTLRVGQILMIPSQNTNTVVGIRYIVQNGDTLWQIAQRYHTTVEEIRTINNLLSNNIRVGQLLIIPSRNIIHIVENGDTLWGIAQKYNTTVDTIKNVNNLSTDEITVGQSLIIR